MTRLGLFIDAAFRADGERVFAGEELLGFSTFAAAVGERFDRFVLISRGTNDAAVTPFPLSHRVEHFALPYYPSLRRLGAVLRALPSTLRALWRSLDEVDLIWISAANPVGLALMVLARLRRKPVAILVRQDTMSYYRSRLPGRAWTPLLAPLWLVELGFRLFGRRHPTTAVGEQIARRYGAPRPNVLEFEVNLIGAADIPPEPPRREWSRPVKMLTVGRIEPEKNPELLAEALTILERSEPGGFKATWAGNGRLRSALQSRARELGVGESLELPGFVPLGEPLSSLYREADVYVHVALTEGVPGVICEAMANGLPIVATDVGGVRAATGGGDAALLVPAGDAAGLADAVSRLTKDPALRGRLAMAGLARARQASLDVESERVAGFLGEAI